MSEPTTADVLNRAAEIIEERGLCRGDLRGPDGTFCAVGAICESANELGLGRITLAIDAMADLLGGRSAGVDIACVSKWNDENALDAADVANHLRKAAERWAERA
jgi:hypothetical protein